MAGTDLRGQRHGKKRFMKIVLIIGLVVMGLSGSAQRHGSVIPKKEDSVGMPVSEKIVSINVTLGSLQTMIQMLKLSQARTVDTSPVIDFLQDKYNEAMKPEEKTDSTKKK